MFDEEPDGHPHGECAAEIHKLRAALLECARQAEALKREASIDQDSALSHWRNTQYQAISTTAHIALGTVRGPASA
jgi:hypothetical protein